MVACFASCAGPTEADTLKSVEISGDTCNAQTKTLACNHGFSGGVDLAVGGSAGSDSTDAVAGLPCDAENLYTFTFAKKPLGITVTGKGSVYVKKMKRDCANDPVCIGVGDKVHGIAYLQYIFIISSIYFCCIIYISFTYLSFSFSLTHNTQGISCSREELRD